MKNRSGLSDETSGVRRLVHFLAAVEIFGDLDEEDLYPLAESLEEHTYTPEEIIFRHHQRADALFLVKQGAVALYRDEIGKPLQLFARYLPGNYFGELGIFEGGPRRATARASEPTLLLQVGRETLLEFLADHPQISLRLHMAAARRHTEITAAVLSIATQSDIRIRIGQQVEMHLPDGGWRRVVLENLSKGGMCLRDAPASWLPPRAVEFSLDIAGETLETRGRVCWRKRDKLGLAFVDQDFDHNERIESALRKLLNPEMVA